MRHHVTTSTLAAVLVTVAVGGCDEVPYCIGDCVDARADGTDAPGDTAIEAGDVVTEADAPPDVETEADAPDVPVDLPTDGAPLCDPPCEGGQSCCMGVEGPVCVDLSSHLGHCGECNNRCELPNAYVMCVDGECIKDPENGCEVNFIDCLEDDELVPSTLGCETSCFPTAPHDAVCDRIDNDCDCEVDEDVDLTSDPDNCGQCGRRCRFNNAEALCESSDGTPENAECVLGDCLEGYWNVDEDDSNGCEYECSACESTEGSCLDPPATCCTSSGGETCNGVDDDCDGDVDEDDPQGGGACGEDEGECSLGTLHCRSGALVCEGDVGPEQEECNGLDDDCDGEVDEPDDGETDLPDEGQLCSDSGMGGVGECEYGTTDCVDGALECVGDVGPEPEECDGRDNDCDGELDDGDPESGGACGEDEGECSLGTLHCRSGALVCEGDVGPEQEECNGLDDDCDGEVDEDFLFSVDPRHCGDCDTDCSDSAHSSDHAIAVCSDGSCEIVGCEPNWWPGPEQGCTSGPSCCDEYCEYTGNEVCDGVDNDCDGDIDAADSDFVVVDNFCQQAGACAGASPVCEVRCGAKGWYCDYGSDVYVSSDCVSIDPESSGSPCDDLDNDCDGVADEHLPLKGTTCSAGIGICQGTGTYVCESGVLTCDAVENPPGTETCNGLDDDCDGDVDDFASDAFGVIGAVNAGGVWVFQHEASRPDAASCDPGTATYDAGGNVTSVACSKAGVQPWTSVSWTVARDACRNLGGSWDLCTAAEWETICQSSSSTVYPYGDAYEADTCNGNDHDTDCPCDTTCQGGDNDEILDTGTLSGCCADWGGNCVHDMSGNVKEWTGTSRLVDTDGDTSPDTNYYEVRGGSSNQPPAGLTCDFDFTIAAPDFIFFNLGFRCCHP